MNAAEHERVLQQLERVVERTHDLQLELLRLHRALLNGIAPVTSPQASRSDIEVHTAVDLSDRPTFSVKEAAAILGVGRDTVYEHAKAGDIPVLRLGRRILIPRAALVRMLRG